MQPVSLIAVAHWAHDRHWGLLNLVALPFPLIVASNLLLRGFLSFGTHYLMHKVPLFWRLHRVHHLDTELDVSSTVRFHPLEFLVSTLPAVPFVAAFGLSPWILLAYEILDAAANVFTHANVGLPAALERWLRYLIVTPDLHRVHHSSWQPETDSNFGAVFPVWDLVCGTFRAEPRGGQTGMQLGLEEARDARSRQLAFLLTSPLRARMDEAPDARGARPDDLPDRRREAA
jgi:sterol desaturase/sphingolipid hydroxylase (fatty acid hydroxylase superfamily)